MRCKKISNSKPYIIRVRVTELEKEHIRIMSTALRITESQFIRMLLEQSVLNLKNKGKD